MNEHNCENCHERRAVAQCEYTVDGERRCGWLCAKCMKELFGVQENDIDY